MPATFTELDQSIKEAFVLLERIGHQVIDIKTEISLCQHATKENAELRKALQAIAVIHPSTTSTRHETFAGALARAREVAEAAVSTRSIGEPKGTI